MLADQKALVDELKGIGRDAIAIGADVGDEEQVEQMIAAAIAHFGTLDILVNNAGIQADAPFDQMTLEQWNRVLRVNLTGHFLCARAVTREFKRRGVVPEVSCAAGKIVNISSVHDAIPWAAHVNYAASKAGVQMLTKSIAQELAPHAIRVVTIAPGAVRTPINSTAWETEGAYSDLMKLVPFNRIGEPHDGGMMLYPGFAAGG